LLFSVAASHSIAAESTSVSQPNEELESENRILKKRCSEMERRMTCLEKNQVQQNVLHEENPHCVPASQPVATVNCDIAMATGCDTQTLHHREEDRDLAAPYPRLARQKHFLCEICHEHFAAKRTYTAHVKKCGKEDKVYQCFYCENSYPSLGNLNRHVDDKH
jgi:hypothetical protein